MSDEGDVEWPIPDEVFADTAAPPATSEPLTLEESVLLDRLDADIQAVITRELELSRPTTEALMPPVVSTTMMMRAASDPAGLARDLARPMPRVTSSAARRGTAFHEWIAASHHQLSLIPEWDLAADADLAPDNDLADLIAGYRRTPYAQMLPYAVEVEVALSIAGTVVRGVIDAVFRRADGTWDVVDWKTNRNHTADPLQLAVYRLAWAAQLGVDPREVTAAFVYVADGEVERPDLPDADGLAAKILTYKENSAVTPQ
jgi:DNA helicase-2/ATP-dependent DNA helicase PcrA